eukprot:g16679.t1
MADLVPFAAKVIQVPFLIWSGWYSNEREEEKLSNFLDFAKGSLASAERLPTNDLKALLHDLHRINASMLKLKVMPKLTRLTAFKRVASEIAQMKEDTRQLLGCLGVKLAIDNHGINSEMYNEIKAMKNEQERTTREMKSLGKQFADTMGEVKKGEVARLTGEIQKRMAGQEQLKQEVREQQRIANDAKKEVEKQSQEICKLKGQLEKLQAVSTALLEEKTGLVEEQSGARQAVLSLQQALQNVEKNLALAEKELDRAKTDLEEANKKNIELTQELTAKKAEIDQLYADMKETVAPTSTRISSPNRRPGVQGAVQHKVHLKATASVNPLFLWGFLMVMVLVLLEVGAGQQLLFALRRGFGTTWNWNWGLSVNPLFLWGFLVVMVLGLLVEVGAGQHLLFTLRRGFATSWSWVLALGRGLVESFQLIVMTIWNWFLAPLGLGLVEFLQLIKLTIWFGLNWILALGQGLVEFFQQITQTIWIWVLTLEESFRLITPTILNGVLNLGRGLAQLFQLIMLTIWFGLKGVLVPLGVGLVEFLQEITPTIWIWVPTLEESFQLIARF